MVLLLMVKKRGNGQFSIQMEISIPSKITAGGKLHGKSKRYNFNEELISEEIWKEGLKTGHSIEYYDGSQIKRSGNYKEGLYDGKWSAFYENGNKKVSWILQGGNASWLLDFLFGKWKY